MTESLEEGIEAQVDVSGTLVREKPGSAATLPVSPPETQEGAPPIPPEEKAVPGTQVPENPSWKRIDFLWGLLRLRRHLRMGPPPSRWMSWVHDSGGAPWSAGSELHAPRGASTVESGAREAPSRPEKPILYLRDP